MSPEMSVPVPEALNGAVDEVLLLVGAVLWFFMLQPTEVAREDRPQFATRLHVLENHDLKLWLVHRDDVDDLVDLRPLEC